MDAAKCLMEHGVSFDEEYNGYTPYHIAAVNGYKRIMKLLVNKHGVDPLSVCTNGTALQLACENGRCNVIEWLVEKNGADVNPKEKITRAAEAAATAAFNGTEIAKEVSPIVAASLGGSAAAVRLLLKYGADLTYDGNKAITVAHSKGHTEVLHILFRATRMRVNTRGHVDLIRRPQFDKKIWRLFFPKSLRAPKPDIARHDALVEIMQTWASLPDGAKLLHMLEQGGFEIPEYNTGTSATVFKPGSSLASKSPQVRDWRVGRLGGRGEGPGGEGCVCSRGGGGHACVNPRWHEHACGSHFSRHEHRHG